jgi:hypothetical protein
MIDVITYGGKAGGYCRVWLTWKRDYLGDCPLILAKNNGHLATNPQLVRDLNLFRLSFHIITNTNL